MTEDHLPEVMQQQLARNMQAVFAAKGERIMLDRTPGYLSKGAALVQKTMGQKLAAFMSGCQTTTEFAKWLKGQSPNQFQAHHLTAAIEVTQILLVKLPPKAARQWMLSPCEYLGYRLPMDEIVPEPDMVRRAALLLIA